MHVSDELCQTELPFNVGLSLINKLIFFLTNLFLILLLENLICYILNYTFKQYLFIFFYFKNILYGKLQCSHKLHIFVFSSKMNLGEKLCVKKKKLKFNIIFIDGGGSCICMKVSSHSFIERAKYIIN